MDDPQDDLIINNEPSDLERQLQEAQEEAQINLNGWKRAAADLENFKRRKEEEGRELVQFAREVVVAKLLPSFDSLSQLLKHAPQSEEYKQWNSGVEGTLKQLEKSLEELGVIRIEALGKKFDPNKHEAVREIEGEEDGVVVEELQNGFEINGKVIRPSQVVISKKGI